MPVALVTGVAGQDGSYLAERLLSEGWEVHGTVRPGEVLPPGLLTGSGAVTVHPLELQDTAALVRVLDATAPDEVYNLAGLSSVAQSWDDPVLVADVNGRAVVALLEALHRVQRSGRVVRLLQASSAEMFSGTPTSPQDESTPVRPTSPYGASKAFAHQMCGLFRGVGVHATSVVLYNHESPRRPPHFVTRKITRAVAGIATGRSQGLVLGNLAARRDWGWAPDYVDAMVAAVRHDRPDDFVVATGVSHSVEDFVRVAFAAVGIADWQQHVTTDPSLTRPGDAVELVGDSRKASTVLGWRPVVAFEEVVRRMVAADLSSARAG